MNSHVVNESDCIILEHAFRVFLISFGFFPSDTSCKYILLGCDISQWTCAVTPTPAEFPSADVLSRADVAPVSQRIWDLNNSPFLRPFKLFLSNLCREFDDANLQHV